MPFKWCLKAYKIAEAGIVLVSASVCMCAEFLRRLVLQNGDIWFWRLYNYNTSVGSRSLNPSMPVLPERVPYAADTTHAVAQLKNR